MVTAAVVVEEAVQAGVDAMGLVVRAAPHPVVKDVTSKPPGAGSGSHSARKTSPDDEVPPGSSPLTLRLVAFNQGGTLLRDAVTVRDYMRTNKVDPTPVA